ELLAPAVNAPPPAVPVAFVELPEAPRQPPPPVAPAAVVVTLPLGAKIPAPPVTPSAAVPEDAPLPYSLPGEPPPLPVKCPPGAVVAPDAPPVVLMSPLDPDPPAAALPLL